MVAAFLIFVVLVNAVIFFVFIVLAIVTLVFRLETALSCILGLGTEASLGLAHLVEFLAADVVIIFENLVLLLSLVLHSINVDNCVSLELALRILQIVHIQLILQIVNIGVLFNVDLVESF